PAQGLSSPESLRPAGHQRRQGRGSRLGAALGVGPTVGCSRPYSARVRQPGLSGFGGHKKATLRWLFCGLTINQTFLHPAIWAPLSISLARRSPSRSANSIHCRAYLALRSSLAALRKALMASL